MTKSYNHLNEYVGFDDVDVLETFPFVPNGCVIFVKTFNSWHGVMPFKAGNQQAIRKSVTINIDYTGRLSAPAGRPANLVHRTKMLVFVD